MLTKSLTAVAIGLLVTNCTPMPGVETASAIVRPPVTAIAAGFFNTCALFADGSVKCWGLFRYRKTPEEILSSSKRVAVREIATARTIAGGFGATCVVLSSGPVQCWGHNERGQLGRGTGEDFSAIPMAVDGIASAKAVAVGASHACAVLAEGSVRCWGSNNSGQLGNGTTTDAATPVDVTGLSTARTVAAGAAHTCALLADGTVQCWGDNSTYQLGNGTTAESRRPVTVKGVSGAIAITAGSWAHTCALLSTGTAQCWGLNGDAQLGAGDTRDYAEPVSVMGIANAVAVAAGVAHTCAALSDGTATCWGLGFGTPKAWNSRAPLPVKGVSTATAVTTGRNHSCALLSDGTVVCWGSNIFGMLGNQSFSGTASYVPVEVVGL